MKARPILFSGPMVRALLAGTKTQTRRIVKGAPAFHAEYKARWYPNVLRPGGSLPDKWSWWSGPPHGQSCDFTAACPYGAPGDLLIVRESFTIVPATAYRMSEGIQQTVNPNDRDLAAIYAAGWDRSIPKWKPSIHMPRWASRLTLEITDVRVERLQDISEADAIAEGVSEPSLGEWVNCGFLEVPRKGCPPVTAYASLWEEIHGHGAWHANPWVWAVSFTVHQANVDQLLAERGEA